jgi:hypothetical protein
LDKYSFEKSVPRVYMENSSDIRSEVLRGLLDTDGECSKNVVGFSSTSKQLCNDVIWLARSLGGKARMQSAIKNSFYNGPNGEKLPGRPCWRVSLQMPSGFKCFYIKRKQDRVLKNIQIRYLTRWIDRIEEEGQEECMCITVDNDNGLYLTNDFIVTHNSALSAWLILWAMSTFEDTKGIITSNTESQLKIKSWAELAKWYNLFIAKHWFKFTATAIYSADPSHEKTWRIDQVPWNEQRSEAFAGMHNKGKRILIIFDEAS